MRKFILALAGLAGIIAPLAFIAPANAGTITEHRESSTAPTMSAPNVARGKTIPVRINSQGSKVLSRSNTLWQNGRRVYDWSPKPGLYRVKSVIRYQIKTTTTTWTSDPECIANGNTDEQCRDWGGFGSYDTITTYGTSRLVTRYDYARVYADETPGCVSRTEWSAATRGRSMTWVHSMFGTSGTFSSGYTIGNQRDVWRDYRACAGFGGDLSINFDNYSSSGSGMRLYTKSRFVW